MSCPPEVALLFPLVSVFGCLVGWYVRGKVAEVERHTWTYDVRLRGRGE